MTQRLERNVTGVPDFEEDYANMSNRLMVAHFIKDMKHVLLLPTPLEVFMTNPVILVAYLASI